MKPCFRLPLLLLSLLVGCGGATLDSRIHGPTIATLRDRAASRAEDPDAQRELALAELLARDGDAGRAAPALARALALDPADARLWLASGLEAQQHGEMSRALDALLRALDTARAPGVPDGSFVSEVAIAGVEELLDLAPDYDAIVRARLRVIAREPGSIGEPARAAVMDLLIELAYRRGDMEAVRSWSRQSFCVTSFRVAGPFGPHQLLGFDEELPAGARGPMEPRYDLGPLRGVRPTREIETRGCAAHLGGGGELSLGGTTYAEAFVDLPRRGAYLLRVETPNAVELSVDGEVRLRLDRRREAHPRVSFTSLELEAGRHELGLKVASRHPNPIVVVALMEQTSPLVSSPASEGPFGVYLRAMVALARGSVVEAREQLDAAIVREDASAALLGLRAAVALADPLRSDETRRDDARRLLTAMRERDPMAWYPILALARLAAAEGRDQEAMADLLANASSWPEVIALPLTLAQLDLQRGWDARADAQVALARRAVPSACAPLHAALASATARDRSRSIEALLDELIACDARSRARLSRLIATRRWEMAAEELTRIAALEPSQSRARILSERVEIATGRGDLEAASVFLSELSELRPRSLEAVHRRADHLLSLGRRDESFSVMDEAIAHEPGAMLALRRLRAALGGDDELAPFRLDGLEVLRQFEASGRSYDEPSVLVLDYTARRVFEDGSSLGLTHNIVRLQSDEAVDEYGEFALPEGAYLLTLRTLSADGRALEPDRIPGKETLSLPGLAIGDYVEMEYVEVAPPSEGLAGGVLGERFYFQSFEMPFDRSELVIAMPESMTPTLEPRGPAPPVQVSVEGGLRLLRWRVDGSLPWPMEAQSVTPREYLPSVHWGVGASWEVFMRGLVDGLIDKEVFDPSAARLVSSILEARPEAEERERARLLHQWVLENIESTSNVFGSAPVMLASRSGHRARVLDYLLGVAGIDSSLLLARSFLFDPAESALVDDEAFSHLIVRLGEGPDAIFLMTSARGVPFGFLDPLLRAQPAFVIGPQAERIRLPDVDLERYRTSLRADVALNARGGALFTVVETYRGPAAIAWRGDLEGVPEAVLEQRFEEGYVSRLIPGARLRSLEVSGRRDTEGPLILRYSFEVASLGRRQGGHWVLPRLLPSMLSAQMASLPSRTTTQMVGQLARDLELRIAVPSELTMPSAPTDVALSAPGGASFSERASVEGRTLRIVRSLRIPMMRVAPAAYPDFASFCRQVDQAEARELSL